MLAGKDWKDFQSCLLPLPPGKNLAPIYGIRYIFEYLCAYRRDSLLQSSQKENAAPSRVQLMAVGFQRSFAAQTAVT
jgi:hypothetical protein